MPGTFGWSPRRGIGIAFLLSCLFFPACEKEAEVPVSATPAAQPVLQAPIAGSRLAGLTLNGQVPDQVARQSGDPVMLEVSDLTQVFQVSNTEYLAKALKLAQAQIDSGKPLKGIHLYFGILPKKYAAKCESEASPTTCHFEAYSLDCNEALPQRNWTEEVYAKLCFSAGRLKAYNPKYLVAAFGADDTLWYQEVGNAAMKRALDSGKLAWGDSRADLLGVYPSAEKRKDYKTKNTPYVYFKELQDRLGEIYSTEFAALAFRGLTLNEVSNLVKDALEQVSKPTPFPEMQDLLRYLAQQGITVGIVGAAPNFMLYPTVEKLQLGIPLENIEGTDVVLTNPADPSLAPVRLSALVNQGRWNATTGQSEKFLSYQDVLASYGGWLIVAVDTPLSIRAGKANAIRSIARRMVATQNRLAANTQNWLDIDDLRMALVGGDSFAPGTDVPAPQGERVKAAQPDGGTQGLSEGLAFLEKGSNALGGTDLLLIQSFTLEPDQKAYPKAGILARFQAYLDQQKLLRPDRVSAVMIQPAVTQIKKEGGLGGFLKETPKTPETQPATLPAETLPTTLPSAETKPAASPVPSRPFGPLPPPPSAPLSATPAPQPPVSKPPMLPPLELPKPVAPPGPLPDVKPPPPAVDAL